MSRIAFRDWSLITGSVGLHNGRGAYEVLPLRKGVGAEKVLALLKGGGGQKKASIYHVAIFAIPMSILKLSHFTGSHSQPKRGIEVRY